jgi:hypothetical protein
MGTAGKVGWALFLVAALVAAYFIRDAIVANARADAAREAFAASEATYQAQRRADSLELAARADSIADLNARRTSAGAVVTTSQPALDRAAAAVERVIPDTATRRAFAEYRGLVQETLDSAKVSIARGDSLQRAWETQESTYQRDLATVQDRLALAIDRAELAERARRPTLLTHATRVLALVGTVVIADRISCVARGPTLLPCGP